MNCKLFFAQHANSGNVCKELQKLDHELAFEWENQIASEHSPGVVQDHEEILRQMFNPTHYDGATGKPKPTAFDDAANKGLSVTRLTYSSQETVVEKGKEKAERDSQNSQRSPKAFLGITRFNCEKVRRITCDEEKRALAVYDTAYKDDIAHSDICLVVAGKKVWRSVRSKLYEYGCNEFQILSPIP